MEVISRMLKLQQNLAKCQPSHKDGTQYIDIHESVLIFVRYVLESKLI